MAQASQEWHERDELLGERTQELHRANVSLQEELEAVDSYERRIEATRDVELRRILVHNRDEEKEHASMLIEWLRRNDVAFAREVALHVGRTGPIAREGGAEGGLGVKAAPSGAAATEGR